MSKEQRRLDGKCINVMQINLGKYRDAQLKMINWKNLSNDYDIIMIQEPYISPAWIDHIPMPSNFRPVLPDTSKDKKKGTVRSVIVRSHMTV